MTKQQWRDDYPVSSGILANRLAVEPDWLGQLYVGPSEGAEKGLIAIPDRKPGAEDP